MYLFLSSILGALFVLQKVATVNVDNPCPNLLEYEAVDSGEISSPNYEDGFYPDSVSCEYRIYAPEGYRIKLTFKDIDIDPTGNCESDRLVVYGKDKKTVIGVFCGSNLPNALLSNEHEEEIRLLFQSDFMVGGRGFLLQYESAPQLDLCGESEGICRNRNCYSTDKMCDGTDDCGDGTDEEDCGTNVAVDSEECGKPPIKPETIFGSPDRMVGGDAALPNSWPWQVSLQRNYIEPNGHFCGGTLINSLWVLTSARCFKNNPMPSGVRLVFGSHHKFNTTEYQQVRMAEKIVSYPDLKDEDLGSSSIEHDITLVKLNAPVTYNDGVQSPCMPIKGWEAKPGWMCYTTGWGSTRGTGHSNVLKQIYQVILNKENCIDHNNETQICVEKPYKAPCHGDNGGPLVCRLAGQWHLLGVTSFGSDHSLMSGLCGLPETKVIFAKVADKAEWIQQVLDKNS